MRRKANNGELFFLFREAGENGAYRIHLPASNGYLLDPEKGDLHRFEAENCILPLSLALGETAVLLLTDELLHAEIQKEYTEKCEMPSEFLFYKDLELTCDENGFQTIQHSGGAISVRLGDWREQIGSAYSGSAVYETEFTIPAEKAGKARLLDLGEVRYLATVYLNGISLETAFLSPFRFKIPDGVLLQKNRLIIVVTNTSANWYVHTDYFNKWSSKELSPYFVPEKRFAKDYVSGGLYGPVSLFMES